MADTNDHIPGNAELTSVIRQECLEALEGQEIRTDLYPSDLGVVGISNGKVIADGRVVDANPTETRLRQLQNALYENEFGGSGAERELREEFGKALFAPRPIVD